MAEFGFELAPEVSEAEREAVSTSPGSALQTAIRSTQRGGGFFSPERLLGAGPGAFNRAFSADQFRREILTGRAKQGIDLAEGAFRLRADQQQATARQRQEAQLKVFLDRTAGMDPQEAMATVTPGEAANPLLEQHFLRPFDLLDTARTSAATNRGIRRREDVEEKAFDEEVAVGEARAKSLLQWKLQQDGLEKLSDAQNLDKLGYYRILADAFPEMDDETGTTLYQRIKEDPEKTRALFGSINPIMSEIHEAASLDADAPVGEMTGKIESVLKQYAKDGDISDGMLRDIARAGSLARKTINTQAALRAQADLASKQALTDARKARREAALNPTAGSLNKMVSEQLKLVSALDARRVGKVAKTPEEIEADKKLFDTATTREEVDEEMDAQYQAAKERLFELLEAQRNNPGPDKILDLATPEVAPEQGKSPPPPEDDLLGTDVQMTTGNFQ